MEKLRHVLVQIFCTKIGWLVVCLFLAFVFGSLATAYELFWCQVAMYLSFAYPFGLTLVMIAYGWVINPIREYKENKKLRKQNKDK